jgi:hypothetical protein
MSKVETMKQSRDSQPQQQTIQSVQQLQAALSSLDEQKLRDLIGVLNLTAQELPEQIKTSSKQVLEHYQEEIQKSISLQKSAFDSMTPESMIEQMQPLAEMQAELIAKEIMPICQSITTITQAAETVTKNLLKQMKAVDLSQAKLNTSIEEVQKSVAITQAQQAQSSQHLIQMKHLVAAQTVLAAVSLAAILVAVVVM